MIPISSNIKYFSEFEKGELEKSTGNFVFLILFTLAVELSNYLKEL